MSDTWIYPAPTGVVFCLWRLMLRSHSSRVSQRWPLLLPSIGCLGIQGVLMAALLALENLSRLHADWVNGQRSCSAATASCLQRTHRPDA